MAEIAHPADTKLYDMAAKKRAQILEQLTKNKWWQEGHDPRPLAQGDVFKPRGKKKITVHLGRDFDWDALCQDLGEGVVSEHLSEDGEYQAHKLTMQPGMSVESGSDFGVISTNKIDPKYVSDLFVDGVEGPIRIPQDIANKYFTVPYEIASGRNCNMYGYSYDIVSRVDEIEPEETRADAFTRFMQSDGMDDPRLMPTYKWMAALFQDHNLVEQDLPGITKSADFIEWQRRNPPGEDSIFEPFSFSLDNKRNANELYHWALSLDANGLDPEDNVIYWNAEDTVWSNDTFTITRLQGYHNFDRQGEMLDQCIKEEDSSPYFDMQEAGHWQMYSLRDKQGVAHGTICMHQMDGTWTILESKGAGNANLDPTNRDLRGKPEVYGRAIDTWLQSMAGEGIQINREDENACYAPEHKKFGLAPLGYSEFHGELIENSIASWPIEPREDENRYGVIDIDELDDLDMYVAHLKNAPQHFWKGELEPNHHLELLLYAAPNEFAQNYQSCVRLVNQIIDIDPHDREEHHVQDWAMGIWTLLNHDDAANKIESAENWMGDLVRHAQARASAKGTQSVRYPGKDNFRMYQYEPQQKMEFAEGDEQLWAARVAELLQTARGHHISSINLPTDDNRVHVGFDVAPEVEKCFKPALEKTISPDVSPEGRLFMPVLKGDDTIHTALTTPKARWRRYHDDKQITGADGTPMPKHDLVDWEPMRLDDEPSSETPTPELD